MPSHEKMDEKRSQLHETPFDADKNGFITKS